MSVVSGKHKQATVRRLFTPEEDVRLMSLMQFPFIDWETIADQMPGRTARQCRERWVNYLSPTIRNDPWTDVEDQILLDKINDLGRCWSTIGHFFNGRSENDLKNRWYSHLRYRVIRDQNGRFAFVTDPTLAPFPERRKRNRAKIFPKENALRIIEQQRQIQMLPLVMEQFKEKSEPGKQQAQKSARMWEMSTIVPGCPPDEWDDLLCGGFGEDQQAEMVTFSELFSW